MPFFKLRFSIIFYGKLGTYFKRLLNSKNSVKKINHTVKPKLRMGWKK